MKNREYFSTMAQALAMTFILCLVIAASLPIKSGVLKSDLDGSHFSITNASNFISSVGGFYGKVGVLTNASGTSIAYTTSSVAYSQLPYESRVTNANAVNLTNLNLNIASTNAAPADTNAVRFWIGVTNADGTVGRIPAYQ